MCVGCTFERMRVICCGVHDMRAAGEWDLRATDIKVITRSFEALDKGDVKSWYRTSNGAVSAFSR